MTLVNDHVLIANPALWNDQVEAGERYETEIAAALRGGEDRSALQQKPWRTITLDYALDSRADRTAFDLAVREGLRTGRVAVPYWVRPDDTVYVDVGQIQVTQHWAWAVGDYAYLEENGAGEVIQIAAYADGEITPEDTLTGTYEGGCARLYPLLFGRIDLDRDFISTQELEARLTFTEPSAVGSFVDYECPAPPSVPTTAAFNVCEGVPVLSIVSDPNACPTRYRISWPRIFGASAYTIWESTAVDGVFTEAPYLPSLDVETGVYSISIRPVDVLHTNRFIRVTSTIGDKVSAPSNTVQVPTITIERVMRATQERFLAVTWDVEIALDWPDRVAPSPGDPGNYPSDDYYLPDLQANLATTAVALINSIRNQFLGVGLPEELDWLGRYARGDTFAGMASTAAIPRHNTTTIGLPGAANSGNYLTVLQSLATCLCSLEYIVADFGTVTAGAFREGTSVDNTGLTPLDDCLTNKAYVESLWAAGWDDLEVSVLEVREIRQPVYNEDPTLIGAQVEFFARRGRLNYDFTGLTKGVPRLFLRLAAVGGDSQLGKLDLYPFPAPQTTGVFYEPGTQPILDTNWTSAMIGSAPDTIVWELGCNNIETPPFQIGFRLEEHVVLWERRSREANQHWNHYP